MEMEIGISAKAEKLDGCVRKETVLFMEKIGIKIESTYPATIDCRCWSAGSDGTSGP